MVPHKTHAIRKIKNKSYQIYLTHDFAEKSQLRQILIYLKYFRCIWKKMAATKRLLDKSIHLFPKLYKFMFNV